MRIRLKDHDLAALLCERWGLWTFERGVRTLVPVVGRGGKWTFERGVRALVPVVGRGGNLKGFTAVTPRSLRALVKRLRAQTHQGTK